MSDDNIQNKNITITEVSVKETEGGSLFKVKDGENKTYTIFRTKKDGTETKAYQGFKNYNIGDHVNISYKEEQREYQGNSYTSRTVLDVYPPRGEEKAPVASGKTPATPQENKSLGGDARGMTRCKIAEAFIRNGQTSLDHKLVSQMEEWVEWVMTGEMDFETSIKEPPFDYPDENLQETASGDFPPQID